MLKPIEKKLFGAAHAGDSKAIAEAIKNGANPNATDGAHTALELAVIGGTPLAVRTLIACGADPDLAFGPAGCSAMHIAAALDSFECIRELAPASTPDALDIAGLTPLMVACATGSANAAKALLAQPGVDPSLREQAGRDAFDLAVERGCADCALALIASKAVDPARQGDDGVTALMHAASNGNTELVEALLPSSDIGARASTGETAHELAMRHRQFLAAECIEAWTQAAEAIATIISPKARPKARKSR